ncbi:MAG: hypothetical protein HeimC3_25210 [Candidatus Heimdallarchaeota archaeon LC_3]|nr:MAG: hypothetical protein HeimC3_25210 [Candidatus Heimdallarchaeota archaeon LC_3]
MILVIHKHTFSVLALLYPNLDYKNKFHIDHIFPRSLFDKRKLKKLGIIEEDIEFYKNNVDSLANLQIMEGHENQEKLDKLPNEWINNFFVDEQRKMDYLRKNYIPEEYLDINKFKIFLDKRTILMKNQYSGILLDNNS